MAPGEAYRNECNKIGKYVEECYKRGILKYPSVSEIFGWTLCDGQRLRRERFEQYKLEKQQQFKWTK